MIVYNDYKEALEVARKTLGTLTHNPNGEGWIVSNPKKKTPDHTQNALDTKSSNIKSYDYKKTTDAADNIVSKIKKSRSEINEHRGGKNSNPGGSSSNTYTFSEAKIIASKKPYARVVKDSDGVGYVIKHKGVTIRPRADDHTQNKYNGGRKSPKKRGIKKTRPSQSPSTNKYDQMFNIPENQKRKADEGIGGSREDTKRNRRGYFGDGK